MRRFAWLTLVAGILSWPAVAQRAPLPNPQALQDRDMITIGVGGAVIPDYEGSDDYRIIPGGAIRARISGISITTNGPYIYANVVPSRGKFSFDAGPIAGLRFNSRHRSDDPVVTLLPKRKTAIELGGFAGVSFRGVTNPYDSVAIHLDVLHDVGDAHESTLFSPNVSFSTPVSRKTFVSLTAALDFASDRYANYYFGVTPQDSLATGHVLPVYTASGGLKDWKTSLLVNQSITGDLLGGFSLFGLGQYSHLQGDFRRSPLVAQRGSAGQWVGALGLAYTW